MSAFDDDDENGQHENEFEENLKRFENMLANDKPDFFDADNLEEIIDYYLQMGEWDLAYMYSDFAINNFHISSCFTSLKPKKTQFVSNRHLQYIIINRRKT